MCYTVNKGVLHGVNVKVFGEPFLMDFLLRNEIE